MPEEHTPTRLQLRFRGTFMLSALLVMLVEIGTLAALSAGRMGMGAAATLHALLCAVVGAGAIHSHRRGRDSRAPLLLFVTTAGTGPFGAAGCVYVAALAVWSGRVAKPFQEWYDALFPKQEVSLSKRVYDRVKSQLHDDGSSSEAASFADIVRFGRFEEKRTALTIMSKNFKPSFAPILQMALRDDINAIRVQAATAVAAIESKFADRILERSEAVERFDEPSAWLALATLYDDYAFTGILDEQRELENRTQALEAYRRYLELEPRDDTVKLAVGRLLVRAGRFDEAAQWLEDSLSGDTPNIQAAIWYMECLYHLRRFEELRRLARRYCPDRRAEDRPRHGDREPSRLPTAVSHAVALWAGMGSLSGMAST